MEAAAEAIEGLAGLADPEADGVDCSSQRPHRLPLITAYLPFKSNCNLKECRERERERERESCGLFSAAKAKALERRRRRDSRECGESGDRRDITSR